MDYAAPKAAVVVFVKSIAPHILKQGIWANIVAPDPTWSVLNPAGKRFTDDYLTNLGSQTPLRQVAQPEEIAPAATPSARPSRLPPDTQTPAEDGAVPPAEPSCESPGAPRGGRPRDPTEPPW
ncbi:SDR family oxidoreductase [Streptomyces sp. NPDC056844]